MSKTTNGRLLTSLKEQNTTQHPRQLGRIIWHVELLIQEMNCYLKETTRSSAYIQHHVQQSIISIFIQPREWPILPLPNTINNIVHWLGCHCGQQRNKHSQLLIWKYWMEKLGEMKLRCQATHTGEKRMKKGGGGEGGRRGDREGQRKRKGEWQGDNNVINRLGDSKLMYRLRTKIKKTNTGGTFRMYNGWFCIKFQTLYSLNTQRMIVHTQKLGAYWYTLI